MFNKNSLFKKIVVAAWPLFLVTAASADNSPLKTAVVNMDKVFAGSKARKSLVNKVDSLREELQKKVTKEEDSLRQMHENLSKQQENFSKDVFEKKKADVEARVMQFRQNVNQYQEDIRTTYEVGMQKIQGELEGVIRTVADRQGVDFVMPSNVALYHNNKSRDITADILSELDAKMPMIKEDNASKNKAAK